MQCRNCGDVVDPRRVELGYDYCLKQECQQRCLKRRPVGRGGGKQSGGLLHEGRGSAAAATPAPEADQGSEPEAATWTRGTTRPSRGSQCSRGRSPRRYRGRRQRRRSGSRRLWNGYGSLEAALDAALDLSYERFRRGEITATELHRDHDRLVEAFNRVVMRENIRYRSMFGAGQSGWVTVRWAGAAEEGPGRPRACLVGR